MPLEDFQKELTSLRRKRGVTKASLTRLRNFVNEFDHESQAISLLEFRQEELPHINNKFDSVQVEIELITDDPDKEEEERAVFEREYFDLRSQIQEIIKLEKPPSSTVKGGSIGTCKQNNRAKLAPISLPTFNGNIQHWQSFFDIFKAMVHNDEGYSPAQKFYYLRSCLSGSAADLISAIPVSDGNYDVVFRRLQQRYDNQNLAIQSHIRSILESPRVEEGSVETLKKLHSHVCTHIAALKALQQPIQHWDAWLITIVTSRLDKQTGHDWQLHQAGTELPKYEKLESFLESRCVALENFESHSNNVVKMKTDSNLSMMQQRGIKSAQMKKSLLVTEAIPCVCCSEKHNLSSCENFKKLSATERLTKVREARLCFNCLSPYHIVTYCKSKGRCETCKRRHNNLLHITKRSEQSQEQDATFDETLVSTSATQKTALCTASKASHVFLSTAMVLVADQYGVERECRVILDNGSQINFISKKLANLLHLPRNRALLPVSGIGGNRVHSAASMDIIIKSRVKQYEVCLTCYVVPMIIEELPSCSCPIANRSIPKSYVDTLADPFFQTGGTVDLLIGGGLFFDLLENERVRLDVGTLSLQDTKLGWVMTGEMDSVCLLNTIPVGHSLEDEWMAHNSMSISDYGKSSKANKKLEEEQETLKHFYENMRRDESGRFVLRLPIKPELCELGNNLKMATSRFLGVERRLQRDERLREEYVKFMDEYLKLGHMQEVTDASSSKKVTYLPHHPVIKTASLTTKLRVVFDASAKSESGVSLNEVLMRGPTVQEDLFAILLRFRKHSYVITADVEKMFRQIQVEVEDRDLQRILWRAHPSERLRTYRLNTVTYGTTPASFMATQCLVVLADESKTKFPEAANSIHRDFYMDDLMTGAETQEECITLQRQISGILETAKLPLRKWCSNSKSLLETIGMAEEDPLFTLEIGADDIVKSLGLCWKPAVDELRFQVTSNQMRTNVTKRMLLSDLNRIFDPLGFLTPVLIRGKIFLQQLWSMKVGWDIPLSSDLKDKWEQFYQQLDQLKYLCVPRHCKTGTEDTIELHGFCDASQDAYGACIYVRCKDSNGKYNARLLCAKSRVASLKGNTIPRLELNGALILSQLAVKVSESWKSDIGQIQLWTDSTIVLGWLNCQASRLKVFVANRVSQILEVTNAHQWKHVRTEDNPADVISRGLAPDELINLKIWWKGPSWMSSSEHRPTESSILLPKESSLPEQRPIRLALLVMNPIKDLVNNYSSWHRLLRAVGWILRFVEYIRSGRKNLSTKYLTVQNLRDAEIKLIQKAQKEAFGKELTALEQLKEVPHRSKLKSLNPSLKNNLLVVGGRLENATIPEEQKRPIVLPSDHRITRLIFMERHRTLLHCGPLALLADIRRHYWPLHGRLIARSVVKNCVDCVRARPTFQYPLMGSLPKERVVCTRPFTNTGVDFAGPLIIRSGIRGRPGKKAWIAIFVCFSTKAAHIEVVEDLTTGAFIAALRRFCSRRGKPYTIWSDNATNFVGAKRELAIYTKDIESQIANDGIIWHFIPPSTPHFGGLWESCVKSAKHHLTRVLKEAHLTLGELQTLLCQIEACLNSRPLSPLSSNPSDLEPLTPAHFLIGGPITLPPGPELTSQQISRLRRWRLVQKLVQSFWERWVVEYLPQLQVRGKWTTTSKPLEINDIVIVKEDNLAPCKWRMARVTNLHPGNDGHVRVVTIRTASGTVTRRPVVKLSRLPINDENDTVENQDFQRGENVSAN